VAILLTVLFIITAINIFILNFSRWMTLEDVLYSKQSYYLAEAGIEDALLRIVDEPSLSSYEMYTELGKVEVDVSDDFGGSRTIISSGDFVDRVVKIETVYEISSDFTSFYYGAQVGEGGVKMKDNSIIYGNVLSNGDILNLEDTPKITDNVVITGEENKLSGMEVGGEVYVDICEDSDVGETLHYQENNNCTASSYEQLEELPEPRELPISEEMIENWKKEVVDYGEVHEGDYIIDGESRYLGPIKIEGDLEITRNSDVFITGTIWVTGSIDISDGTVKLDESTYGSQSGLIIADGQIAVRGNPKVTGSDREGSYLALISTLEANGGEDYAIDLRNQPELDILYASRGRILIANNVALRSVSGWGLEIRNHANVTYETGMESTYFTSGPGGSWNVLSWRRIR